MDILCVVDSQFSKSCRESGLTLATTYARVCPAITWIASESRYKNSRRLKVHSAIVWPVRIQRNLLVEKITEHHLVYEVMVCVCACVCVY